jgi:adenylylsulfate kinase
VTGFTVWFTGLSGAGKSTLADMLEEELRGRGLKVEMLDGDVVRTNLSQGLGFSKEDRDTNILRIGFVANLLTRNGVATIVSAISPYRDARNQCRDLIGDFVEVFVDAPLGVCVERDVKGLYKKAISGEIPRFTGVSDPYEPPDKPDLVLETDVMSKDECLQLILDKLQERGYIEENARLAAKS